MVPKRMIKEEFAKALYGALLRKGWTQAELSRRTGIQTDSISYYMSGKNMPGPANAKKLADALGVPIEQLVPTFGEDVGAAAHTSDMEIKVLGNGMAWLSIQKAVKPDTAARIFELINSETRKDDAKH